VGSEFELWGGDIWGKNIEVKKNTLLKQEWYAGEWPAPSIVTFQFVWDKALKKTVIDLMHSDFPESEGQNLVAGWDRSFFGQIHAYIEANKPKESHAKTATV
jgi:activator of HSP90 ATPase